MKTQRIKAEVLRALDPDYYAPEKTTRRGVVLRSAMYGRLHMTTPELVEWCNNKLRHGSTSNQMGNVMSKLFQPTEVIKIATDTPRGAILSGSYGVASWCRFENFADAVEDLYGGPDMAWTATVTAKGINCAARRIPSNGTKRWITACGKFVVNLSVEEQCGEGLITCNACSNRWAEVSQSEAQQ